MNWDAIGALAEITGSVAVFATLVYLAVQVRHSARSTEINSANLLSSTWSNFQSRMSQNETPARALAKAYEGERLESFEVAMLGAWLLEYIEVVDNEIRLVEEGVIKSDLAEQSVLGLRNVVSELPLFGAISRKAVTHPERRKRLFGESGT